MSTYYNEIDPYAAQWLRNLMKAGVISDGFVDERSIQDVAPQDLAGFTRAHFFAGIGVWDYALGLAGWPDHSPVWTGSCPCQPFSAAGKGGGFDDERHLWPDWFWLIAQCQPDHVFGEQVASGDGLTWLDLVQPDLEGENYAVGAGDLCSASVGAPHIRQRLYWYAKRLANPERRGLQGWNVESGASQASVVAAVGGAGRLGHPDHTGLEGFGSGHPAASGRHGAPGSVASASEPGRLAYADSAGCGARSEGCAPLGHGQAAQSDSRFSGLADTEGVRRSGQFIRAAAGLPQDGDAQDGGAGGMADADPHGGRCEAAATDHDGPQANGPANQRGGRGGAFATGRGQTNGFWRAADWLHCRDGKWRPVEPGTFPLAHGVASRMGRLRAYGNAVNAEVTAAFIAAAMRYRP